MPQFLLVLLVVLSLTGSFLGIRHAFKAQPPAPFHEQAQFHLMVRDMEKLRVEYLKATYQERPKLRADILYKFGLFPEDKMPDGIRQFYKQLKATYQ